MITSDLLPISDSIELSIIIPTFNCSEYLDECLKSTVYQNGREEARNETWANRGDSISLATDYLIALKQRIDLDDASMHSRK